jgi:hypothetical protein
MSRHPRQHLLYNARLHHECRVALVGSTQADTSEIRYCYYLSDRCTGASDVPTLARNIYHTGTTYLGNNVDSSPSRSFLSIPYWLVLLIFGWVARAPPGFTGSTFDVPAPVRRGGLARSGKCYYLRRPQDGEYTATRHPLLCSE